MKSFVQFLEADLNEASSFLLPKPDFGGKAAKLGKKFGPKRSTPKFLSKPKIKVAKPPNFARKYGIKTLVRNAIKSVVMPPKEKKQVVKLPRPSKPPRRSM